MQLMVADLLAYLSVLIVSSKFQSAGPTLATMTVLVLPPKLSCNSRVSLESLQGAWHKHQRNMHSAVQHRQRVHAQVAQRVVIVHMLV
jgi:hypothetical protein